MRHKFDFLQFYRMYFVVKLPSKNVWTPAPFNASCISASSLRRFLVLSCDLRQIPVVKLIGMRSPFLKRGQGFPLVTPPWAKLLIKCCVVQRQLKFAKDISWNDTRRIFFERGDYSSLGAVKFGLGVSSSC